MILDIRGTTFLSIYFKSKTTTLLSFALTTESREELRITLYKIVNLKFLL